MADVNTNTFDDEQIVENPMIQGGQKYRKVYPCICWTILGSAPSSHCVELWTSTKLQLPQPERTHMRTLPKKYARESESFRDFQRFLHVISTRHRGFYWVHAVIWTMERCALARLYSKKQEQNHYWARIYSGMLCGGQTIGKTDAAFAIKIPVARPWLTGAIPYNYTLSNWHNIYNDSVACLTSTFTLCTRENCTIVGPYDVESSTWLGHTASSIR